MSNKNIIISINNPCKEDWNKMTDNIYGKFCDHCKENVIDFTNLSDNEIIRIIENNKNNLCGRFNEDQLNRVIAIKPTENNHSFFARIAAALMLFTSTKEALAHTNNSFPGSLISTDKQIKSRSALTDKVNPIELTGTIYDANTNKPIPNAKIMIVSPAFTDSSHVYTSDEDGNYSIPIPDSTERRTISLMIAAADYQETTIKVSYDDYSTQNNVFLSPVANGLVVTSYKLIKKTDIVGGVIATQVSPIKPKKHFNFFNLFRKKKNRK